MQTRFLNLFSLSSRALRLVVPLFICLLFFGAMVWAKSEDPFVRKWFKVKTASCGKVECVAVLPKPLRPCPVVFYLHGSGGTLMTDGRPLRQMAELGMVTVSFEYNQTNYAAFEEQFSALLETVKEKGLLTTDSTDHSDRKPGNSDFSGRMAWVGDSLGAQYALRYCLSHTNQRPNLLVQMGGGWVPELEEFNHKEHREHKAEVNSQPSSLNPQPSFLLVHGERDEVFPIDECRKAANALSNLVAVDVRSLANQSLATSAATNRVDVRILPGLGHSFEPNRALVIRQVGEYIKAHLTPEQPLPEFPKPPCHPFLACAAPAFVWVGYWAAKRRKNRKKTEEDKGLAPLAKWEIGLRVVAVILAVWAAAETAIHLVPPHLQVGEKTLKIAKWKLLAPKWQEDFAILAKKPIWEGQKLKTLLTHVELANYCVYELINWKLPQDIYREYVLSPVIPDSEAEMNWRRPLWEFYYPRIRKENTTEAAAEIIARTLRERVTVVAGFNRPQGVDTIWKEQITGEKGFQIIYVATLRSAGVPARLDANGNAEFWQREKWQLAPRPLSM